MMHGQLKGSIKKQWIRLLYNSNLFHYGSHNTTKFNFIIEFRAFERSVSVGMRDAGCLHETNRERDDDGKPQNRYFIAQ